MKTSVATVFAGLLAEMVFCASPSSPHAAEVAKPAIASDGPGEIDVEIVGIRNDTGRIGCQLFAGAVGFPRDTERAVARQMRPLVGTVVSCRFSDLNPGTYAVAVMHDENGNGRLDTNLLGVPTEGYGVSENHTHALRPPSWEESRFSLAPSERKRLVIRLVY
jgi:uncharacterized protein (DUF2141 family)